MLKIKNEKNSSNENASKSMEILEKEFDIPQLFSPNDLINGRLEEGKVIKYLEICRDKLKDVEEQNDQIVNNPNLKNLKNKIDKTVEDYEKTKCDPLPLHLDMKILDPLKPQVLREQNISPSNVTRAKSNFIEPNVALKKFAVLSDYKLALATERHIKNMEKLKLMLENNNDNKELKHAIDEGKKLLIVNINLNHQDKIKSLNPGKEIERKYLEMPESQLKQFENSLKTGSEKVNPQNVQELKENDIKVLEKFLEKQKIPQEIGVSALTHSIIEELDNLIEDFSEKENIQKKRSEPHTIDKDLPLSIHSTIAHSKKVIEMETERLQEKLNNLSQQAKNDGSKQSLVERNLSDQQISQSINESLQSTASKNVLEHMRNQLEEQFKKFNNVITDPVASEFQRVNASINYKAFLKNALATCISPLRQIQMDAQSEMKIVSHFPFLGNQQEEQKYIDQLSCASNLLDKHILCAISDQQVAPFQRRNLKKFSPLLKSALKNHLNKIKNFKEEKQTKLKNSKKEALEKSAIHLKEALKSLYDLCSIDEPLNKLSDSIKKAKISLRQLNKVANAGDFLRIDNEMPKSIQELNSKLLPVLLNCQLVNLEQENEKLKPIIEKLNRDLKEANEATHKLLEHAKKEVKKNAGKQNFLAIPETLNDIGQLNDSLKKIQYSLDLIPSQSNCELIDQLDKSHILLEALAPSIQCNDIPFTLENSFEACKHAKNFAILAGECVPQNVNQRDSEELSNLIKDLHQKLDENAEISKSIVESKFEDAKCVENLLKNSDQIDQLLSQIKEKILPLQKLSKQVGDKQSEKNAKLLNELQELEEETPVSEVDDALLKLDEILEDFGNQFDKDNKEKIKEDLNDMMKELDFGLKKMQDSLIDPTQKTLLSLLLKEKKILSVLIDSTLENSALDNYQQIINTSQKLKELHSLILRTINSEIIKAHQNKCRINQHFLSIVPHLIPIYDNVLVELLKFAVSYLTCPPEKTQKQKEHRLEFLSESSKLRQIIVYFISLLNPKVHFAILCSQKDSIESLDSLDLAIKNKDHSQQDILLNNIFCFQQILNEFASKAIPKNKRVAILSILSTHKGNVLALRELCLQQKISSHQIEKCKNSALEISNIYNAHLFGTMIAADSQLIALQILLKSSNTKNSSELSDQIQKKLEEAVKIAKKQSMSKQKGLILDEIEKEARRLKDNMLDFLLNESIQDNLDQYPKFKRAKLIKENQHLRKLISRFLMEDEEDALSLIENSILDPQEEILNAIVDIKEKKFENLKNKIENLKENAGKIKKNCRNLCSQYPENDSKRDYENLIEKLDENLSLLEKKAKNIGGEQAPIDLLCELEKLEDNLENLSSPPLENQEMIEKQLELQDQLDQLLDSLEKDEQEKKIGEKFGQIQNLMKDLAEDSKKIKQSKGKTLQPLQELRKALVGENVPLKDRILPEFCLGSKEATIDQIMENYYENEIPNLVLPERELENDSLYDYIDQEEIGKMEDSLPKNAIELNIGQRENLGRLIEKSANGDSDAVKKLLKKILQNVNNTLKKAKKILEKKKSTPEKRKKIKGLIRDIEQNLNDLSRDAIKSAANPNNKVLIKLLKNDSAFLNQNHQELIKLISNPSGNLVDEMRKQIDWQDKALNKKNPHAIQAGAQKLSSQTLPLVKSVQKKSFDPLYSDKEVQENLKKLVQELNELPKENLKLANQLQNKPKENPKNKLEKLKENNRDLSNILDSLESSLQLSPIQILLIVYQKAPELSNSLSNSISNKDGTLPKHIYDFTNYYQNAINSIKKLSKDLKKPQRKKLNKIARKLDDSLSKHLAHVGNCVSKINKKEDCPVELLNKVREKANRNHDLLEDALSVLFHKIASGNDDLKKKIMENHEKKNKGKEPKKPNSLDEFDLSLTIDSNLDNKPTKNESITSIDLLGDLDLTFLDSPNTVKKETTKTPQSTKIVPQLKSLGSLSMQGEMVPPTPRDCQDKIKEMKKKHNNVLDAIRRNDGAQKLDNANQQFKIAVEDAVNTMQNLGDCDPLSKKVIEKNLKNFEELIPLQNKLAEKYKRNPSDENKEDLKELNNDLGDLIKELEDLNLDEDEFSDLQKLLGEGDQFGLLKSRLMDQEDPMDKLSFDEGDSYDEGDSLDDELLDAIQDTRDLSKMVKEIAQDQDKNDPKLENLLEIIDELEEFIPRMIDASPSIKDQAMLVKKENSSKDPVKNKELLKNFEGLHNYLPQVSKVIQEEPLGSNKKAKNKNKQVKKAIEDEEKEDLEDALEGLSHINSDFLEKALLNLEEMESGERVQAQKILNDLKTNLPLQEKKAKTLLDQVKEKKEPKENYSKWKKKTSEEQGEYDYSSDSDSSSSEDDSSLEDKIEEEMDDLALLFPDLQLNGDDVEDLLHKLNDPNFALQNEDQQNKKNRRKRKKKKETLPEEFEDFPLFGPGEGSIRLKNSEWNRPELDLSAFYSDQEEMALDPLSLQSSGGRGATMFDAMDPLDFDSFDKMEGSKLDLETVQVLNLDEQLKKIDNLSNLLLTPSQAQSSNHKGDKAKIVKATSPQNLDLLSKSKIPHCLEVLKQMLEKNKDPLLFNLKQLIDFVLEIIKMCKVVSASLDNQQTAKQLDSLTLNFVLSSKLFIETIGKLSNKLATTKHYQQSLQSFSGDLNALLHFFLSLDPQKHTLLSLKKAFDHPQALSSTPLPSLLSQLFSVCDDLFQLFSLLQRNHRNKKELFDSIDQNQLVLLLTLLFQLLYSIELILKKDSPLRNSIASFREILVRIVLLFFQITSQPTSTPSQIQDALQSFSSMLENQLSPLQRSLQQSLSSPLSQQFSSSLPLSDQLEQLSNSLLLLDDPLQPQQDQPLSNPLQSKSLLDNQIGDLNNILLEALTCNFFKPSLNSYQIKK